VTDPIRALAHDLNNVFAAVLGCADLLAIRLQDNASALADVTEIQRAAQRGARLTKRLFALAPRARPAGERRVRRPKRHR